MAGFLYRLYLGISTYGDILSVRDVILCTGESNIFETQPSLSDHLQALGFLRYVQKS